MFNVSVSSIRKIFKNQLCFFSKSKSAVIKAPFFITLLFFLLLSLSNTNAQTIQVISPNGGEVLHWGEVHEITWIDNISDNVNIFLYKGGTWSEGGTKTVIASNVPSDGNYSWTILNSIVQGEDYKIQVKGVNHIEDENFMDYSDSYFTITESIRVITPNGGESWHRSATYGSGIPYTNLFPHEITWNDYIDGELRIDLYHDGEYDHNIRYTENDSSYTCYFGKGQTPSNLYKIRIQSVDDPLKYDFSDDYFTISEAPTVHVTLPNGGEVWRWGEAHEITWLNRTDNITERVNIFLYEGGTWSEGGTKTVIATNLPSDVSYTWTIPNSIEVSGNYKIQVKDVDNIEDENLMDYSDEYFSILEDKYIVLTYPNGGEHLAKGETYAITWTDIISENVRIDLWKGGTYDQGGTQIVITTSTESDGSYNWTVPTDIEIGMDYKIRVKSVIDPSNNLLFDYSDTYFTIVTSHSQSNVNNAVDITISHEQEYQISAEDDVDWYSFSLLEGKTYRVYNTSTINLDTELYLHRGFLEDFDVVLIEIVALDDNSGGNQQPFFDYLAAVHGDMGMNFWLQVALDYNEANETEGDYTLHIYELSDKLNLKMFLEGAYNETTDMMNTELGTNIPKNSPYSDVDEQTVNEIPEGVVDWVLIELRDKDDNLLVVTSRSAFLLNTGMIVDTDGVSDVQFNAPKDSYYIVVKHRNHLPAMSTGVVEF